MPSYAAPLRDMQFVLHEVLEIGTTLATLPGYEDATPDVVDQYLDAGAQFAVEVLTPLNRPADEEGCHFQNGVVTTPAGFKAAYTQYCELGFSGLDCDPQYGGQGMPKVLAFPIMEMMNSASVAWAMYPGLSHGAYNALSAHGTAEQKAMFLPKLVDGSWSGTMCLTEPHCGTDLGLVKTKAEPLDGGGYKISGTKIFISAGEHDLTENILHLTLARLPGAPEGIKGISLFLVPKFMPTPDGKVGARNAVAAGSIEHKMGIKANATCVINFDGAIGWLIGEPNKGMSCMFTMMNAARLGCGMQGLSLGEVSYQNALIYAKDRLQMRALGGAKAPEKAADPIIVHPDVRRMLLTGKAYTEAGRAFSSWLALLLDIEDRSTDSIAKQDAADLVALLTPVAKAFMTDNGFTVTNLSLQVFGGHGYIREWGMEQFVRDCRISQIYEGTNTIQALDLLGRKVLLDQGQKLRKFTKLIHKFCAAEADNPEMSGFVAPLDALNKEMGDLTMAIGMQAMQDQQAAGAAAVDYLRLLGHLTYAYFWARMAKVALAKSSADTSGFYEAKLSTARFYFARLFPEVASLKVTLRANLGSLMSLDAAHFSFY